MYAFRQLFDSNTTRYPDEQHFPVRIRVFNYLVMFLEYENVFHLSLVSRLCLTLNVVALSK